MPPVYLDVEPRKLRASPNRVSGADPMKLARQIAQFGTSTAGMPPLEVWRCKDDELVIADGMTRATRVAQLLPGQLVRVVVVDNIPQYDAHQLPTLGDLLP
jgi:hypothetical protein